MKKYYIYLSPEERNMIIESLVAKKNMLTATGKYTDGVDEVLLKIMRAKLKKAQPSDEKSVGCAFLFLCSRLILCYRNEQTVCTPNG